MNRKTTLTILLALTVALLFVITAAAADPIGDAKCKMCHKVQHASWSASKHATADPKVDCETCHGPGSEYKSMKVMKDSAAAKAAGLIMPTLESCNEKCHAKANVTAEQFAAVHEHKAK